jgi:hypothetical protein
MDGFVPTEQEVRDLLTLFTFAKKADLERYCRDVVIKKRAFTSVITASDGERLPFLHLIHWTDYVGEHLKPTEKGNAAIAANGVGLLQPDARKAVRKIFQLFEERRWLVGHMFFTPDVSEWHFVYFDQRDTEYERPNHWKGGPHIHFVNWLWSNLEPEAVWSEFIRNRKPPGGALHVRYDNRPPAELIELQKSRQSRRRPPRPDP